jgi:hypothetical protein
MEKKLPKIKRLKISGRSSVQIRRRNMIAHVKDTRRTFPKAAKGIVWERGTFNIRRMKYKLNGRDHAYKTMTVEIAAPIYPNNLIIIIVNPRSSSKVTALRRTMSFVFPEHIKIVPLKVNYL